MHPCSDEKFKPYRSWFIAAGVYNLVVGGSMIVAPRLLLGVLGIPDLRYLPLWQVLGMFILVYAPAYLWAARKPFTFRHYILLGFAGKVFGPVGYLYAQWQGSLPPAFGWLIVFNDLAWWPAFGWFLVRVVRSCGGWRALTYGD